MPTIHDLESLSDQALLAETSRAAAGERLATARLVALLAEVDSRRVYLGQGCSSLVTYCTQVLRLSGHAAYGRIEAARAARQFPEILARLEAGALTLTAIGLLRAHLTDANHRHLLDAARHKSKRHVEEIVAGIHPQPAVPATLRKLPCPPRGSGAAAPATPPAALAARAGDRAAAAMPPARTPPPPSVRPLAPERYRLQLTISAETQGCLRQVQDLMRHQVPDGDLAVIVDRAIALLLEHLQRTKIASHVQPRRLGRDATPASRHIPASVRREVWRRDGGRCAFVGVQGRCHETGLLEFHHVIPFALGGAATRENVELRRRSYNVYEAGLCFSADHVPSAREDSPGLGW